MSATHALGIVCCLTSACACPRQTSSAPAPQCPEATSSALAEPTASVTSEAAPAPPAPATVSVPATAPTKPTLRRSPDPNCEPEIDGGLATAALEQAEALITAHGDHVDNGELRVILPLLRLAAHAGNVTAQLRYGYYVFGYWMTDEMFWPRDAETAVDALAMLHVAAKSNPELLDANNLEIGLHFRVPQEQGALVIPKAWARRAEAAAAEWERCRSTLPPRRNLP
jgi:hypothetical protein